MSRALRTNKVPSLKIVIMGLSLTSSWGNGHATTYRGLVRELTARGHDVLFLERDVPWYASNRDLPEPPFARTELYSSMEELRDRFSTQVRSADFVMVGSYVPQGVDVGEWVLKTSRGATGFYDIDTPVTLAKLASRDFEYLSPALVPRYDLYLSFTGGTTLEVLKERYGAKKAHPLYCSVDPNLYYPEECECRWDLGYLGTYSRDRQQPLERLMLECARQWGEGRFIIAGPLYPEGIEWPKNVTRVEHIPPESHRRFYNSQRFTLNITREDMVRAGYSPSVRLFEAAACGTPIISDNWEGLDSFFEIGTEIFISSSPEDTLAYIRETPESTRKSLGRRARERVLNEHTAAHRAAQLEDYVIRVLRG